MEIKLTLSQFTLLQVQGDCLDNPAPFQQQQPRGKSMEEELSKYHDLLLRFPPEPLKEAKEYDRFLNPFFEATKKDITVISAALWKLRTALSRVKSLMRYYTWWRRTKLGNILQKIDGLASEIDVWCNGNRHGDDKTFHLRKLLENVSLLEDLLDDIEYTQLKHYKANVKMMRRLTSSLTLKLALIMKLRKLKELLQNMDDVIKELFEDFGPLITESTACGASPSASGNAKNETYVLLQKDKRLDVSGFISGDNDEELVMKLLDKGDLVVPYDISHETKNGRLRVHEIFHDRVVADHFELLIHVRSSDRHLITITTEKTISASILKMMNSSAANIEEPLTTQSGVECRCRSQKKVREDSLPGKESKSGKFQGGDVKEAQEFIEKNINNKKLLLVLDDVLEDQLPELDDLLSAVSCSSLESRVIITSQSSEVLKSVSGIKFLHQRNIQHDIFWRFFESFAFGGVNKAEHQMLEQIGKNIAEQLKEFPLAAKMVGKMLNARLDYRFWETISQKVLTSINKMDCRQHQLLALLKLCYNELTGPLSLCFQYCSLFPNDWTFTPESLVQLWLSQGFLTTMGGNCSNGEKTIEEVGRGYFDELHSRSFFEKMAYDGDRSFYMLHTSVHCLAQIVAGEEYMRIDSHFNQPNNSQHVRHLSIKSTSLPTLFNVDTLFNLRTLIIFGPVNSNANDVLSHILDKLTRIRTLDLAGCSISNLPKLGTDIRKHLCYLSCYDTGLEILPNEFTQLLHLQVLNIQGCRLQKLPQKMNRLCNLRHVTGPTLLTSTIHRIGKLKALQELEEFPVSKKQSIQQLGGIKDLGGAISITNLEKVKDAKADKAKLYDKRKLNSLKLEWSSPMEGSSQICGYNTLRNQIQSSTKVLEHLKPPSSVTDLEINGYIGFTSPSWFTSTVLNNIVDLKLLNCVNWDKLPPLGELPLLKSLKMENWDGIKSIGKEFYSTREASMSGKFPNLEELCLEDMPELEVWDDCDQCFANLQRLVIRNCSKLRSIPLLKSSELTEICLEEVGLVDLPLSMVYDHSSISLNDLLLSKSVTRLDVRRCPNLTNIGVKHGNVSYLPSCLLYLFIIGCGEIKKICFRTQVSLQELHIEGCSQIEVTLFQGELPSVHTIHTDMIPLLDNLCNHLVCLKVLVIQNSDISSLDKLFEITLHGPLFKTLKKLCLIKCQNITSLPNDIKKFSSLKSLQLKQCNKISSLPHLPLNLDEICIDECPLLKERYHEDGPDWIKISHIPYKSF
ncbi:unnamed protein product [Urochloa decumbens]|uniref:NB-ARC domain-containing protein n=1 Tax=Urochloa decumbens TaxID=240449 RepID=A0ABC9HDC6_9POAL